VRVRQPRFRVGRHQGEGSLSNRPNSAYGATSRPTHVSGAARTPRVLGGPGAIGSHGEGPSDREEARILGFGAGCSPGEPDLLQ